MEALMRFTKAEKEMIRTCVMYVLTAPALEVIEEFTPKEEKVAERLERKIQEWR